MFLTTQEQTNGRVRFAITTTTNTAEQVITSAATLATGWHHIAVVLDVGATYTGTLYIDGTVAGTNTGDDPAPVEHRRHRRTTSSASRPTRIRTSPGWWTTSASTTAR